MFPVGRSSLLKLPVYFTTSSSGGLQDSALIHMPHNAKSSKEALLADSAGVCFSRTTPPPLQHTVLPGEHPRLCGCIIPLVTVRCDFRQARDRAPVRGDVPSICGNGYRMSYLATFARRLRTPA